MSIKEGSVLLQITSKLKSTSQEESQRNYASTIFTLTKSLETEVPSVEDFEKFIEDTHDLLIKGDSSKRCSVLRAIRYCLTSRDAVQLLLDREVHYVVVSSLEKDGDSAVERMQALKIIERVQQIAPELFPVGFARSLVAVANYKDDSFRKICIEALRDLSLSNPSLVAAVEGFTPMMDAVLEPITQTLADSIVLSIIYLLNDPATRAIVAYGVDLRTLMSSFTDLDSTASDLAAKWKASKSAIVLLMRSWVGVVQLSAEEMAWPTLVRMLKDPKVPQPTQEIILDTIMEIFEPVMSKVKQSSAGPKLRAWQCGDDPLQQALNTGASTPLGHLHSPTGKNSLFYPGEVKSRPNSERIQLSTIAEEQRASGIGLRASTGPVSQSGDLAMPASTATASATASKHHPQSTSKIESFFGATPVGTGHSAAKLESFFGATPTKSPPVKESGRSSFAWGGGGLQSSSTATAQELMSPPANTSRKTFSMSNFFSKDGSRSRNSTSSTSTTQAASTSGATTTASSGHVRRGSTGSQSSATGSGKDSAILFGMNAEEASAPVSGEMSTLMKIFNMRRRRGSKQRMFRSRPESPGAGSTGSLASSELRMAGYFNEQEALMDPIYNMMDNYKALLCSSFLHSNLIESLYFLGVNGANAIAQKSRRLMVNFLRIMAYIFPEDMCSELLTIPSLIEFAASVASSKTTKRAHKSTQILLSLAEAFTLMPYKQVCGNHISGLSLSPRQRPSIAATISGGVAATVSKGAIQSSSSPSPAVIARANFPPLNIQTIFELAEEIKISTFSTISSGESTVDGTCSVVAGVGGTSTAIEVLNNLRNNLTPEIDKNDFIKQMDLSKVIGKEGKEPFRWDWVAIGDMLEYSFHNSSRLSDALKTKWVRRISGFYRCSVEEKGYFANLDWEPIHLQYLECASNMYSVLLKDEAGMNFLTSDRRGMLFNEIAHEVENLTLAAGNTNITPQTSALQKNVFRLYSCQCTMSREFFTLLGRIVHNTGSKHLMSGTSVFANLLKLGQYRSLDYASRLVLTSLSFTDGGIMSRQLMQQWTQKSGCTAELRAYSHTLLRILLRSGAGLEAFSWLIDAIASQLDSPRGLHTSSLYKALEEAVHDKSNLRAIIAKRPKLLDAPQAQRLLVRFLCIPEGIEYLSTDKNGERVTKDGSSEPISWLSEELDAWRDRKSVEYVAEVDRALTLAFAQCDNKIDVVTSDPVVQDAQGLDPIPIRTTEFLSDLVVSGSCLSTGSSQLEDAPLPPSHSAVKLANSDNHGSGENNWYSRDPNSNLLVDLHGLVRVPWNIEVKIANSSSSVSSTMSGFAAFANGGTSGVGSTVMQQSPAGEYLRVDSFLDATYMPSPLCHEITSDAGNLVKVRGIIVDNRGFPTGHPIPYTKVVSSTLLAGVCPVTRTGRALLPGEIKTHRRRSTATEGAYEAVSRMSSMNTNTNSLAECPLPNSGNSYDLPVSYYLDAQYDWSSCKATHRQNHFTELPDGLFSVTVPGEPVVLIFSRRSPSNIASNNSTMTRMGRSGSMGMGGLAPIQENVTRPPTGNAGRRTPSPAPVVSPPAPADNVGGRDVTRASGVVWLVEVQYIFRLETGNSIFVPMPTHIYGELTRTMEGCEIIAKRKIVTDLLARAHQLYNMCTMAASAAPVCVSPRAGSVSQEHNQRAETAVAVQDLQAAMWALGHTGSNELGCALILEADRKFLPWCIENVYTCPYYNLRGTFFHVLGLLSRTQQGSRRLLKYGWDSAPRNTHSAVAFPLRSSSLFRSPGSFARPPQSPRSNQTGPGGNMFPFTSPPPLPPTPTEVNTATSQPLTSASVPTPPKSSTNSVAAGFGLTISTAPLAAASAATAAAIAGRIATSPNSNGGISPRRVNTIPDDVLSQLNVFNRTLAPVKNLEIEVLQLIAKLPGVIVYKECKTRLELLRRDHPSLFAQRGLYLQAHHMLESYTFKLTARRDVLALFADEAKMKAQPHN